MVVSKVYRRFGWGLVLASLFATCGSARPAWSERGPIDEYHLKAAFLINFARYAHWPSESFASDTAPLEIVILGDDPFGPALEETLGNKTVHNRPVVIRRVASGEDPGTPHLLFIAPSEAERFDQIVAQTCDLPILTVGDHRDFCLRGGILNFFTQDQRVRFEVNLRCSRLGRVQLSAHVLKLARIVTED